VDLTRSSKSFPQAEQWKSKSGMKVPC
jgi:hypothetical protein